MSKFNVGDKVRVASTPWYYEAASRDSEVHREDDCWVGDVLLVVEEADRAGDYQLVHEDDDSEMNLTVNEYCLEPVEPKAAGAISVDVQVRFFVGSRDITYLIAGEAA